MVKYSLRKNQLAPELNKFTARISGSRSFTREEIIDRLAQRGSAMTRADIQSVLSMHDEEVCAIIADGGAVNTPLLHIRHTIRGVFEHVDDLFDHRRHRIHVTLSPGLLLKEALRKIRIVKVEASHTEPVISQVYDVVSGISGRALTRGGVLRIIGNRLKFDSGDEEQGVFLIAETGEAERCSFIADNLPARLTVIIPQCLVDTHTYMLEVRTRLDTANKTIKYMKKGRFDGHLHVIADNAVLTPPINPA